MVFFTCNACGSSLKKNQVEKHYQNECRNCEVLSCIDCGQDFYGDEYMSHTKCISEAEKYQGSFYKKEESSGKGEKKQQEWLEKAKQSASSANVSPKIARLLDRVLQYPNIPRKKAKFENFVRNSCNVYDGRTLTELWEAFGGATKQQVSVALTTQQERVSDADKLTVNGTSNSKEMQDEKIQKKTKVQRAEDLTCNGATPLSVEALTKSKNKKISAEELEASERPTEGYGILRAEVPKKKKKKKRSSEEDCVTEDGSSLANDHKEHSLACESEQSDKQNSADDSEQLECCVSEEQPSPTKHRKHQLDSGEEEYEPVKKPKLNKVESKKHKKKHKHKQR